MNKIAKKYIELVDGANRIIGQITMFFVLGMIGVLLFESISRTFFNKPHVWSIELSQFIMAAYYIMGGAYTLILDGHVRMDLAYHKWSVKKKALFDAITFLVVLIYLVVLLKGSWSATLYAIKYHQVSYSAWKPSLIPIKVIMTTGIFMMFLQTISELIKDIYVLKGKEVTR